CPSSSSALLFTLFLVLYSLAMAMNGLIIFITWTDLRLNSPYMYFSLGHLSFLDICFITATIPQMLVHLVVKNHTVSFVSWMTQMYLVFFVGVAECILLAFMAYDHYVASCYPISYMQIMNQVCVRLMGFAWIFGLINGIFVEYVSFWNPFLIALSCDDPQFIPQSSLSLPMSTSWTPSSSSWRKTLSTCASHQTVVIFFYTSAMFSYMNPCSTHGPNKDKPFSLLYTIITPMCNPIIYSLRNKEMKGAVVRAFRRTTVA
uniref:Olfactory receptor family 10 subfamily AD member 1 n=1 Tax=Cavia porcellus TaxID=10141 RepID=A0A286Y164_CAVPO